MKLTHKPLGRPLDAAAQFRQIADDLRKRLVAGEWPPGTPLPPLRRLAQDYKVTLDVVRAAILVMKQEERIGVMASRRLTSIPGMSQIPGVTLDRLVLIVYTAALDHFLSNPEYKDLHDGIQNALGQQCIPFLTAHSHTLRTAPVSGFFQLPIKGMISLGVGVYEQHVFSVYENLPFPVVIVDHPIQKHKLHAVCVDNVAGARLATERLIALGHRRIAFLRVLWTSTLNVDPDSRERQAGFQAAMRAAKLRSGEVFSVINEDTAASAAYQAIADPKRGFTAALCVDSGRARMLKTALTQQKREVPKDFSIACFHGSSQPAEFSGPCTEFYKLGQKAVALMQEPRRPCQIVRVLPEWREGKTVAAKV